MIIKEAEYRRDLIVIILSYCRCWRLEHKVLRKLLSNGVDKLGHRLVVTQ